MSDTTKYVVLLLQPWNEIEPPINMDGGSVGCMLVFDTEERARKEYPDARILEISVGPRGGTDAGTGENDSV